MPVPALTGAGNFGKMNEIDIVFKGFGTVVSALGS